MRLRSTPQLRLSAPQGKFQCAPESPFVETLFETSKNKVEGHGDL